MRGLGDNNTRGTEGGEIGKLYDDGKIREHDDRFANDSVYTNIILVQFKQTNLSVYKEFYVSLMGQMLSSTVEIAGAGRKMKCCYKSHCDLSSPMHQKQALGLIEPMLLRA
jgi:hypothetical protein